MKCRLFPCEKELHEQTKKSAQDICDLSMGTALAQDVYTTLNKAKQEQPQTLPWPLDEVINDVMFYYHTMCGHKKDYQNENSWHNRATCADKY